MKICPDHAGIRISSDRVTIRLIVDRMTDACENITFPCSQYLFTDQLELSIFRAGCLFTGYQVKNDVVTLPPVLARKIMTS